MSSPALFQPIRIGDVTLSHRVVLAPLTRLRNDAAHVPTETMVEYYTQGAWKHIFDEDIVKTC